jgi:hypothetical protein
MSNLAKKQNVATEQKATMEIVKTAPSNGSAVVIEETVAEVVAEEKAPVIVPEVKPVIVPNLSQRIEKVENSTLPLRNTAHCSWLAKVSPISGWVLKSVAKHSS